MCNIRIKGKFKNISIVTFYAPTEDKDEEEKDDFYEMMEQVVDKLPNYDMKIIMGDANAKIGKEPIWREVAGKESLHDITSSNGVRLCSFAMAKDLRIMSTSFQRKNIHKETWMSPDGRTRNQIDHVLVDNRNKSSVSNIRSIREAECGSDHHLILVKLTQRISLEINHSKQVTEVLAVEKLKKQTTLVKEFRIKLHNRFQVLGDTEETEIMEDIENKWETFRNSILNTAKEVCGKKKRARKNPWFDGECEQAILERSERKKKWLNSKSNEDREEYFRVNKETTRTLRKKKREYLKGLLEKAERDQSAQNARDFFKCVRHFRSGYTANAFGIKDKEGNILVQKQEVTNRWREHFEELLNGEEIDNNEEIPIYHDVQPLVENPSIEEVEQALNSLKDNKSPGEDAHVKARRIRWAGHALRRERGSLLKEASIGKPEGKRPLGRPKKRWWDSVSRDVREVGAEVEEAEDRERWKAVVGAVKSRLGHKWPWERASVLIFKFYSCK
ncbi:uncharacterized protein LOC129005133 [Macrosteles quadrilineatus]|uniref:uncharacterized protein LOC129005133 n=1 Tax=Macrosteles quadrilineatus TaxID=74068 RepID=UPI0023E20B77|nr:uncharacterized protein LOC129005133 [Macrosteles quadrilineatus]